MPPAGSRIFFTVRVVWYVTFSVTRDTVFDPFPGRDVGRGRLDAVPGTPVALGAPELSSVRCELTITDRVGSNTSSLTSPPEKSHSTDIPARKRFAPRRGSRVALT